MVIEPLNAMRTDRNTGELVPNTRCPSCRQDGLRFDRTEGNHNIYLCGACGLENRYRYAYLPYGSKRWASLPGGGA